MSMTMPDFIKSIDSGNDLDRLIGIRFDEISVLYSIIGNHAEIISISEDTNGVARFTLLMENEVEATKVCDEINGLIFTLYGSRYLVNLSRGSMNTVVATIALVGKVYQPPTRPKSYSE